MTTLLISDFKARCIEVLNTVHDGGEPVVVTRRGKPLARIVPVTQKTLGKRQLGAMSGEATATRDIVHAHFTKDWESAR